MSGSLLVSRCLGLGDFVTAVPALRALEAARPEHHRFLAAPAWYRDLVRLAGLRWKVVPTEELRPPPWTGPAPDLAVNLHGRGPQSTAALRTLSPGRIWAYASPGTSSSTDAPWPGAMHDARLWCGLLEWNGVGTDPTNLRWPRSGPGSKDMAIVHPGAASASRRWPPPRFAQVARWLTDLGLRVLITGSSAERLGAERVAREAGLGPGSVVAGRTDLRDLARLVHDAMLLVCGDTGVAHLATAYGTPSVRLFGPVPPALWGPLVDFDIHVCLWSGRRGDPHSDRLDPGLASVTVAEVQRACERLLWCAEHTPTPTEGRRQAMDR
ncbi:glycosyltransferase family 9 protein [Nocardiopsis alkaliphila]|uniref:glycosyltransferase family 9 protein n=1 Tax=Nocardiopsis alkaliphila TaxID=225762 RepID=UPI00036E6232|nr:glycosyltransferase family 9 protein [Nocardiopsis alkaliphila]